MASHNVPKKVVLRGNRDLAQTHIGEANSLLNNVERMASFQGLSQLSDSKTLGDGTIIEASFIYNLKTIVITSPAKNVLYKSEVSSEEFYRVIVGSNLLNGQPVAAIWTKDSGWELLGTLPGHVQSEARSVSYDGTVVAGTSAGVNGYPRAFIWTRQTGMVPLEPGTGTYASTCYGMSGDGRVITGAVALINEALQFAYIWSRETGMQVFSHALNGGTTVSAEGNDLDFSGTKVLGNTVIDGVQRVFTWSLEDGAVLFPKLHGPDSEGAKGVTLSDNGQVVNGEDYLRGHVLRWVNSINTLTDSYALWRFWTWSASRDGSIVVGHGLDTTNQDIIRGFIIRSAESGIELLPMLPEAVWSKALGISPDGNVIVGQTFVNGVYRSFYMSPLGTPIDLKMHVGCTGSVANSVSGLIKREA